ncbi:hypothetical protein ACSS6W_000993 [Trichoderma asperelloides]|uniref:Extracellular protein n=1 Tax=Trichoderma asperellum TaxID=101201 RepID=A0A6V8QLV2_TRIAP|nr:hypothetical protein LI328DRAFT_149325 [Trichoderma asperelloides]GFP53460.1 hypothetical protein TASIC1_0002064400 [Trichoderma asperellum]
MKLLASILGLAAMAQAHMELTWPYAFRSKYNPNVPESLRDYSMTSPLLANGSNYPCKGYQVDFNSPEGRSTVTWQAGGTYNFSLSGSATHEGGSCQVSLSYDQAKTWKVVHSWIGSCPLTPTWTFTLPNDTPAGDALFAWTWFNKIGNREMYMNCAHVTILDRSGSGFDERSPSDPYLSRPAQFVANVNNGCGTLEGKDVLFPNPGPDTDMNSQGTAPPTGSCPAGKKRAWPFAV